MGYVVFKYAVTAAVVVAASEVAKRSDRFGALILSLPLITMLTLIWLFVEKQGDAKISNLASYTFWYVLPTLPMLLLFPSMLQRWGFISALTVLILGTIVLFILFAAAVRRFGIDLW